MIWYVCQDYFSVINHFNVFLYRMMQILLIPSNHLCPFLNGHHGNFLPFIYQSHSTLERGSWMQKICLTVFLPTSDLNLPLPWALDWASEMSIDRWRLSQIIHLQELQNGFLTLI